MDVSNFNKTKGLSGNKLQVTAKNKRQTQFNLDPEIKYFSRDVWPQSGINWRKYFPTDLPHFFSIQSGFSGRFGLFHFRFIYSIIANWKLEKRRAVVQSKFMTGL